MHMHPGMSSLDASKDCIGTRIDHPQNIARLVGIVLGDIAVVEIVVGYMPRIGTAVAGMPRVGTVDIAATDRRIADIAPDGSSLGVDIARTDHAPAGIVRVEIELLGAQVASTEAVDTGPADPAIRALLAPGKDCSRPWLRGSREERRRVLIGDGEDKERIGDARQCCIGMCREAMVAAQSARRSRRFLRL